MSQRQQKIDHSRVGFGPTPRLHWYQSVLCLSVAMVFVTKTMGNWIYRWTILFLKALSQVILNTPIEVFGQS